MRAPLAILPHQRHATARTLALPRRRYTHTAATAMNQARNDVHVAARPTPVNPLFQDLA